MEMVHPGPSMGKPIGHKQAAGAGSPLSHHPSQLHQCLWVHNDGQWGLPYNHLKEHEDDQTGLRADMPDK